MRRIISSIAVVILLISMIGCAKTFAPTWEEQYDLGVRYLSEGKYEEAIIAFTTAIEIDAKQAPAYVGRGSANMAFLAANGGEEELLRQAADDFIEAIAIDPSIVDAYTMLSEAYLQLGDVENAIGILHEGFEATGVEALLTAEEELASSYASVNVSIERQDITYTSEITGKTTPIHYDLVTVKGDDPRIDRINQTILADFEEFKIAGGAPTTDDDRIGAGVHHEWLYNYLNSEYDYSSFDLPAEVSAKISCNGNGILSIQYMAHYYYDYHCEYGMTFDLLTGEQLSYTEYFSEDKEAIIAKIRAQLQTIIDEQWAMGLEAVEVSLKEGYDYSLLNFYIQDNELTVCSPRLFAGDGSVWTTAIPCGVFINEWDIWGPEPAVVSFERKDHSISNASVNSFYDLPVVEGNTPGIRKINGAFEELYNDYKTEVSEGGWVSELAEYKPYPEEGYFYVYSADTTYNENNVLCVRHSMSEYMGGLVNGRFIGEVFDMKTGNRLGLRDLFYRDDDSLLAIIKEKITEFVRGVGGFDNADMNEYRAKIIADYTLDSLDFYIEENGELIIYIPRYTLAEGAAGALIIPCELYIGVD